VRCRRFPSRACYRLCYSIRVERVGSGSQRVALICTAHESRWVDAAGSPVADSNDDGARVGVELVDGAGPLARLLVRPGGDHRDVIASLTPATQLALCNAQLAAVAKARLLDVQESRRRIVEAGDGERRRIERDLHDGAQQRLVSA